MKRKLLSLVISTLCFITTVNASHVAGMRITYEYTGNGNDYIFTLHFVRDCFGVTAPTSMMMSLTSSCNPGFNVTLTQTGYNTIALNSCATPGVTTCQGGTMYGAEEYIYQGVATVPPCVDWVATASICCWSAGVTNLINSDFYSVYVETTFDNLNFPGNSSPEFNGTPVSYYCAGIPSLVDYSAIDIDGDSLHYEFVPVIDNPGFAIPMAPGYTYDQPIASFVPTYLDPLNGMMLFTASSIQQSSIAIMVSEYRNNALIGTILLEELILVTTGISSPDTITGRVFLDYNSSGVFDIGDQPVPNVMVKIDPGNIVTPTAGNGKYDLFVIDGIWDITVPNPPQYMTITPASINVNTTSISFSGNNDFIADFIANMDDLEIRIYPIGNPITGQTYGMHVNYENSGTTIQSNPEVTVVLDSQLEFDYAVPVPTTIIGNTLTWSLPSMYPFTNGNIQIWTTVDTTAIIGDQIYYSASITPVINDQTPLNNSSFIDDNVATSCDPNFKEVFPSGDIDLSFIAAQDWLTYRIHFQNLGTAPAQIVRIHDLLDPDLEYSTLEFIASSFPCAMTFTGPNQLEFTFTGINLPAASVNEPGSHGFVEYRIRPKATLQPGMYITNNAGIYFDFNAPVYTNIVYNEVVTSVGFVENTNDAERMTVYPVPASDYCNVEIISTESRNIEIEIYSLVGSLVKKIDQKLSAGINRVNIPVVDLSNGNYFISVIGNNGRKVSKFTVVRQ